MPNPPLSQPPDLTTIWAFLYSLIGLILSRYSIDLYKWKKARNGDSNNGNGKKDNPYVGMETHQTDIDDLKDKIKEANANIVKISEKMGYIRDDVTEIQTDMKIIKEDRKAITQTSSAIHTALGAIKEQQAKIEERCRILCNNKPMRT